MEDNHIYQYSLINALMSGVGETGITVAEFLKKGSQGIGTFVRIDGELIALDGKLYQLQSEGRVREASPSDQIPYGVITNFVSQQTKTVKFESKECLDRELEEFNKDSANLFLSYRIEGRFKRIKARTVRGQEYKGQPLSELGDNQFVATYEDVDATIVGFRSPKSWQGFTVAGQHLHFITDDRQAGGHVLEMEAESVKLGMATIANCHIELPTTVDFNAADLVSDADAIKKVEG